MGTIRRPDPCGIMNESIAYIAERILVYDRAEYVKWRAGDKSMAPVKISDSVRNQPSYHFGEMFALRYYNQLEGWKGFTGYAIGPQYPGSEKRSEGRAKLEKVVPPKQLRQLRALRIDEPLGSGEPDVFLHKDDGTFKFVEVTVSKGATESGRRSSDA